MAPPDSGGDDASLAELRAENARLRWQRDLAREALSLPAGPAQWLGDYRGYVHADAYGAYDGILCYGSPAGSRLLGAFAPKILRGARDRQAARGQMLLLIRVSVASGASLFGW